MPSKANMKILLSALIFFLLQDSHAKEQIVSLSEKIEFHVGDIVKLKNTDFLVTIKGNKGTECAVPGRNCGSGYIPPHPEIEMNCHDVTLCPYVVLDESRTATSGTLSIEDEKSCETHRPEMCFYLFTRFSKSEDICQKLKSPMGRYYCLKRYEQSARPENKGLCDQLPESVYALRWNCFYEYAVRYRDVTFCDKYPAKDIEGKDRCLLKMAEINKDFSLCGKISSSKEHNYIEQCQDLKQKLKAP